MRVIVAHNYYQQPGGEDRVFADEVALLRSHGHEVTLFEAHNDDIRERSKLGVMRDTLWNRRLAAQLRSLVEQQRAEVVHFHNTFPLISPAGYYAARRGGAAVVQTLHNFRLLCPAATFFRDGKICESCLSTRTAWPAIVHGCYRDSRLASAAVAGMLASHRALRTWRYAVDRYVALTEFSRDKFIEGRLPADKIAVKPNFVVDDLGAGAGIGGFALFVGRLTAEKGIGVLLDAWRELAGRVPLKIAGDGPLADMVRQAASSIPGVEYLGARPHAEVQELIGQAAQLVLPSTWYEGFPKTIVEAFARGTPVVASRLGAMAEVVSDGHTGKLFAPGSASELAAAMRQLADEPDRCLAMRTAARQEFEAKYTAARNYEQLLTIYRQALAGRRQPVTSRRPQPCEVS